MPEQHIPAKNHCRKIHPQVVSYLLSPARPELPNPQAATPELEMDPLFSFDPQILNNRLGSLHVKGIPVNNIVSVIPEVKERRNELAFGAGIEGVARKLLSFHADGADPFSAELARYEDPGEVWILTARHAMVEAESGGCMKSTSYGLMPMEDAAVELRREYQRRRARSIFVNGPVKAAVLEEDVDEDFNKIPEAIEHEFEALDIRILPNQISCYTRALQTAARLNGDQFDLDQFREAYFAKDNGRPELTAVAREIKQEYLGKTNIGTIVLTEVLMRAADFGLGIIPVIGGIRDYFQAATGKEFPVPVVERAIRHELHKADFNLPQETFEKPEGSRWLEVVSGLIGTIPPLLPVAWLAEVPLDAIMEWALLFDKTRNTRNLIPVFWKIAQETGTIPEFLKKLKEARRLLPPFFLPATPTPGA